eukprot:CAMPEP_0116915844 /NCGR_PEP_ID=MMETSP0467-20121206/18170_1 /TAXON_ID=283647 /ORGANISM="Mesodinium pulex, Strain SPMC105" /LENGTH=66 /DNA_ID=CAMNT_0004592585 /DNA_START=2013 /DNA_END=2213 /DNA_ORIENTATION=+
MSLKPRLHSIIEDKTENWKELNKLVLSEYNIDLLNLNREERYSIKEFEEELQRKGNYKCVFPSKDY